MNNINKFLKKYWIIILLITLGLVYYYFCKKSKFTNVPVELDVLPKVISQSKLPFDTKGGGSLIPNDVPDNMQRIELLAPDVKEETGFPVYGNGANTDRNDSRVLISTTEEGPLHTEYSKNESVGESPYSDTYGSRILKINSTGIQNEYSTTDLGEEYSVFSGNTNYLLKNQSVNREYYSQPDIITLPDSLKVESSPGQYSETEVCESTYPQVYKHKGLCLNGGDLPYNQAVNGKVNNRLLSREQVLTGNYNAESILSQVGSGNLYPVLV